MVVKALNCLDKLERSWKKNQINQINISKLLNYKIITSTGFTWSVTEDSTLFGVSTFVTANLEGLRPSFELLVTVEAPSSFAGIKDSADWLVVIDGFKSKVVGGLDLALGTLGCWLDSSEDVDECAK